MNLLKKVFIFQDVNKLDGVGQKLSKYLKKKKIEKVKDIILLDVADGEHWPQETVEETEVIETNENKDEDSLVKNASDKIEADKVGKTSKNQDDNTKSQTDSSNEKPIEVEWNIDDHQQDLEDNGQIKIF